MARKKIDLPKEIARLEGIVRRLTPKYAAAEQVHQEAIAGGDRRKIHAAWYDATTIRQKIEWAEHKLSCLRDALAFEQKYGNIGK